MDKKQAKSEIEYRLIKIVLREMLREGVITESEFEAACRELIRLLNPLIGSLEMETTE